MKYFNIPFRLLSIFVLASVDGISKQAVDNSDRIEYGFLEVPEDHDRPLGKTINIAWAIVKAKESTAEIYPIIFLTGGPGGETLPGAPFFLDLSLSDDRDIILFDQRGIGKSSPLPDFGDGLPGLLAADLSPDEEEKALAELIEEYRNISRQKDIDLHNYNSSQSARDIGMIMDHFEYDKYHLMGGSYGTRLARIAMDLFPDQIESAILDSPNPFDSDFLTPRIESYELALSLIFERCSMDADCREEYPDLKTEYLGGISALYENSILIELEDLDFYLNPQDAIYILRYQLYRGDALEGAPALIRAFKNRDKVHIKENVEAAMPIITDGNYSMFLSVERFEHYDPGLDRDSIDSLYASRELFPAPLGFFTSLYLAADMWHDRTIDKAGKSFSVSEIPTIIYVNKYDPVTPPENGKIMQEQLNNSYLFILDEGGHGEGNFDCKINVSRRFFDNPSENPVTECLNVISE